MRYDWHLPVARASQEAAAEVEAAERRDKG
jgi:hypothetical protein